jgi:serine phosphatase RsbU (regulator of sigma subunit)/Tfp pilus assembly protein PilF
MKFLRLILFFVLAFNVAKAQDKELDSLLSDLKKQQRNTIQAWKTNDKIAKVYVGLNKDSAKYYAQIGIEIANRLKNDTLVSISYQTLGVVYSRNGDETTAINLLHKALTSTKSQLGTYRKGDMYRNLGNCFYHLSSYDSSIVYYYKALEEFQRIKYDSEAAGILNNIGNVYYFTDSKEAIRFYQKALDVYLENGDLDGQAKGYGNLGLVWSRMNESKKAVEFSKLALEKAIQAKLSPQRLSSYYVNLGLAYDMDDVHDLAIFNIQKGLKIREENQDAKGIAIAYCMLGPAFLNARRYEEAEKTFKIAIQKSHEYGLRSYEWEALQGLSSVFYLKGNMDIADSLLSLSNAIHDSIYTEEKQSTMQEIETKYETKEKDAQILLLTKQGEIKDLYIVIAAIAALFLAILSLVFYFVFKNNEKKNKLLEAHNLEISRQKKEITDSINYAKKIQTALMPKDSQFKALLPKSFVFYRPKDIVSGDFYWAEKSNEGSILVSAVDCTGHGVPGAFMSVIGINLLNSAIAEHSISHPSKVLEFMNIGVRNALQKSQSADNLKDGMDIGICQLDLEKRSLNFAGAYNPIILFKGKECIIIKGDKLPIGGEKTAESQYTNHPIQLNSGDRFYLFTDGFGDQFGGPEGKKYKKQRLINYLESIQNQGLESQLQSIEKEFYSWMGNQEQVDDVLVIGVEV